MLLKKVRGDRKGKQSVLRALRAQKHTTLSSGGAWAAFFLSNASSDSRARLALPSGERMLVSSLSSSTLRADNAEPGMHGTMQMNQRRLFNDADYEVKLHMKMVYIVMLCYNHDYILCYYVCSNNIVLLHYNHDNTVPTTFD